MRVAVSLLAATAAGMAVIFFVPALLIMGNTDQELFLLPFVLYLDVINTAPIWMPLAPIFAAWAYYSCFRKLSARNESSPAYGADALPGWKIFRATIVLYLVMAAFIVAWFGEFAYRTNYVCSPGRHIVQSDADAIEQAQRQFFRARFRDISGDVDGTPGFADFSRPDCCKVKRTLMWTGVIQWEVSLNGETIGEPKKRHVTTLTMLSNCGAIFAGDSYISVYP